MTNLKEVNFGLNQYCGPSVLSALTGESTDRCAAVISAVSGRQEIKAVQVEHLLEAFRRLRFTTEKIEVPGTTLYGKLLALSNKDGMYVVLVPHHVVAIEVNNKEIYLVDNHSKAPLPANSSARLMQKVEGVYKVSRKSEPKFIRSHIIIGEDVVHNRILITSNNIYENLDDNTAVKLGEFRFKDKKELLDILDELSKISVQLRFGDRR